MKNILIFIFIFKVNMNSGLYAQFNSIDSLQKLIAIFGEDSNKVNHLNQLSNLLLHSSPEQSLSFAKEANILAEKITFNKGKALALKNIGKYFFISNNLIEAAKYWEQSLKIYTNINDENGMSNMLNNLGSLNYNNGTPERALTYYFKALELAEKSGNTIWMAVTLNNVGLCYMDKPATYEQAISYFKKGLKVAEKIKDKVNIGSAYINMGELYMNMGKDSLALVNLLGAMEAYEPDDDNLPYAMNYIGKLYQKKKDYTTALDYHNKALKKSTEKNNQLFIVQSNLEIAEIYRLRKLNAEALEYFKKANTISDEIKASMELKRSYEGLASTYNQLADFRNAYSNLLHGTSLNDSLYIKNMENRKNVFEMKMKEMEMNTLLMDQENAKLEIRNQKNLMTSFLILIGLFIIGLILARNNFLRKKTNTLLNKQKIEIENTLAELKSTQSQLIQSEKMASLGELTAGIAHEIQNPLNFINNFSEVNKELLVEMHQEIENGNLPEIREIAKDLVQNMQKINLHGQRADSIVKGMLQHSRTSTGQKEPRDINALIDEYLRLAYHGFRSKDKLFKVNLQTSYEQSIGEVNIIPQDLGRVILNLNNNAFYAVSEKSRKNIPGYEPVVTVTTKKINDKLEIRVKDNGMGIPEKVKGKIFQPFFTTKPSGQGTGLGLSLSYDIIKSLQGSLDVNSAEGEFTEFIIKLPV